MKRFDLGKNQWRMCSGKRSILFKIAVLKGSRPEVFLGKVAFKICSKFTGEHPIYFNKVAK